jgi:hypothetical protein
MKQLFAFSCAASSLIMTDYPAPLSFNFTIQRYEVRLKDSGVRRNTPLQQEGTAGASVAIKQAMAPVV